MTDDKGGRKSRVSDPTCQRLQLENGHAKREPGRLRTDEIKEESASSNSQSPSDTSMKSASQSPLQHEKASQSPFTGSEKHEEIVGGEITVKQEPGQPPKLSRSTLQKVVARSPPVFNDYEDKIKEARETFEVIPECSYSSKYIGSSEHDSMDCDCTEEWDSYAKTNTACGADSDCINRATKMECVGDCGCGADCQNQRFQQQQFADVTVIQTEKKGYGLRTNRDLSPDEMVYEYIGEVIDESRFRRRTTQYNEDGIKHFYFMSLSKGEFIDATKKGNLGRFCNHSCNPNCYVDKWVVGEKLRMGIFAERKIKKGEELVFNYNVDRYGADPQPCYCGEPNCTGFLGGKTQTERGTKLSNTTIEALGIDDGDGWDTAVAKKPRKKKTGENDEEYVNDFQPKSLDEGGVTKVMATLMQCKEKWIAVKLLGRIQRCDDERVRNRVVKMHGYQILNSTLALWKEDPNVVLQVFDILDKFPRLTRNKISDSKIESTVESLLHSGNDRVETQAASLLKEWSTLEVAYRIPRKKREAVTASTTATPDKSNRFGRRDSREERKARSKSRSRSRSKSIDAPRGPAAPSGPRSNFPQRNPDFYAGPRPAFRPRPFNSLPPGWFPATDENGRTYYYDASGKTTWQRPTLAATPPPPPPKPTSTNKALEDIINEITSAKANTPKDKPLTSSIAQAVNGNVIKESKGGPEKWRTYSEEKQKKLYENTLFPHVKYVMEKFKGKLSKDDLKRFAKEVSKKLVSSDYKNQRVEDPTKISSRQEKQIKKYVQDYFEKAVTKKKEHDKKKAERKIKVEDVGISEGTAPNPNVKKENDSDEGQDMAMSEDENEKPKQESATPVTPMDQLLIAEGLKRKRGIGDNPNVIKKEDEEATPSKRLKSESPPPPPPPPPLNEMHMDTPGDSNAHSNNEGSPQILTGSHEGPFSDDVLMENLLRHTDRPPPPPPPMKSGNLDVTDAGNLSIHDAYDIAGNAHVPDPSDPPNMELRNNEETINEHERLYSAHGHRPELSVQGGVWSYLHRTFDT